MEQSALVESGRTEAGQFVKGVSGNPAGRPRHKRLKELQQDLEIAVREHLDPERIKRIILKVAEMAEGGNLKAAKLIMDKTVANAQIGEDTGSGEGRTVVFRIENATIFPKQPDPIPALEVTVIESTEAKHE